MILVLPVLLFRKWIWLPGLIFLAFNTMAASKFSSRLWQMEEGLPHTIVQAITQTSDGYLWVGTREGLARFNGVHFEPVELAPDVVSPSISALHGASDGSLWIGAGDLGLFRWREGTVSRWNTPDGKSNYSVLEIAESTDHV